MIKIYSIIFTMNLIRTHDDSVSTILYPAIFYILLLSSPLGIFIIFFNTSTSLNLICSQWFFTILFLSPYPLALSIKSSEWLMIYLTCMHVICGVGIKRTKLQCIFFLIKNSLHFDDYTENRWSWWRYLNVIHHG